MCEEVVNPRRQIAVDSRHDPDREDRHAERPHRPPARPLAAAALAVAGLAAALWALPGHTAERATAVPAPAVDVPAETGEATQTAVLAGGCFWGVQAVFQHVKGVTRAVSGYSGGAKE